MRNATKKEVITCLDMLQKENEHLENENLRLVKRDSVWRNKVHILEDDFGRLSGIITELKQEIILLRESRDTHKAENIELKKELDKYRILCLRRGSRIYQLER
jgi:predicted metal-dependent hydrolase